MKLIIDIPDTQYHNIMDFKMLCLGRIPYKGIIRHSIIAIQHGIPLDKIKKEIDEQSAMHMDGDFYIRNFDVKRILSGNEVSKCTQYLKQKKVRTTVMQRVIHISRCLGV